MRMNSFQRKGIADFLEHLGKSMIYGLLIAYWINTSLNVLPAVLTFVISVFLIAVSISMRGTKEPEVKTDKPPQK
jgi:hypothetical protein